MIKHKSSSLFLLVALFIGALVGCSGNSYTIMTYNIRHGVGMDRVLDLQRVAKVIDAANPDILILNEVDHGTVRAFGVLQAESLGKRLDMDATFGRSIDFDSGQYGNALLSKFPVLSFQIFDLSTDSLLEGRSVFLASILLEHDTLFVMGTHLGLTPDEGSEQVERIIQLLPQSTDLILAGDFNFEPNSDTHQMITKFLSDGVLQINRQAENTFPADQPVRRIDYIFIGSNIQPVGIPTLTLDEVATASDHQPQVLNFQLK